MTWVTTDGTEFALGGRVTGTGPVAVELRRLLARFEVTGKLLVHPDAQPSNGENLDLQSERHLSALVRLAAHRLGSDVASEPAFEVDDPRPSLPDGVVY